MASPHFSEEDTNVFLRRGNSSKQLEYRPSPLRAALGGGHMHLLCIFRFTGSKLRAYSSEPDRFLYFSVVSMIEKKSPLFLRGFVVRFSI